MLTAADPITWRPRRIAVAGVSGAGKTTLAARLAEVLDAPHVEVDALFHGPGWVRRPEFADDVDAFTRLPSWTTEWQYADAREVIAARADTLLWLDLPARVALYRIWRRTILRRIHHEELWNGNHEPPLHAILTERDHVVRWAVRTRPVVAARVPEAEAAHRHLAVVRLRSQRDADTWVEALGEVTRSA